VRVRWCWLLFLAGCGRIGFGIISASDAQVDADPGCDPCAGAAAAVLDNFDRGDGGLTGSWLGDLNSFLLSGDHLALSSSGAILWPTIEPADGQWAEITLTQTVNDQEVGIVLQAQATTGSTADRIEVNYHVQANAPGPHLHVNNALINQYTTMPIMLADGTHLRAVARAGHVEVFADGVSIYAADPPNWGFPNAPGYIGVGSSFATPGELVDDFRGGACGCP
jgi:hypothetical protein